MRSRRSLSLMIGALALASVGVVGCATESTKTASKKTDEVQLAGLRRINGAEYRHTIADIFGPDIKIAGRFEPESRREGLFAIGAGGASVSPSGMEQYYAMATGIADQVVAPAKRDKLIPCKPASATAADDACATQVVAKYGRLLFRRPLTDKEIAIRVTLAHTVAEQSKDFYAGLHESLTSLLTSPDYFFRVERLTKVNGKPVLDAYGRASRLSYMFWDTTPDEELLAAADSGAIMTPAGLTAQVDRLIASPRSRDGVRAFFDDMLQLQLLENQSKDPLQFPKFNQQVSLAAREETLRTVTNLLVDKNADYRDIFTTRDTFINRPLAIVYKVPFASKEAWMPYTFPADSGRSGLLTEVSFLSLFSQPARSSPTKRGVALLEIFLCQTTPSPPANVDFSIVNQTQGTNLKTSRARLEKHATDETCAGCHSLIDPPGLALEHFDSLGQSRLMENGVMIDVTSEIDGVKIDGAAGLAGVMRDNPRAPNCLVRNLYASLRGHEVGTTEEPVITALTQDFVSGGYKVPAFMKRLALSEALFSPPPPPEAEDAPVAPPVKKAKVALVSRPIRVASNNP